MAPELTLREATLADAAEMAETVGIGFETYRAFAPAGWEPPPLLAEFQDGRLLLQDGNHRYESLSRAGESHAWVLIFFDDPSARDEFVAGTQHGAPSEDGAPR